MVQQEFHAEISICTFLEEVCNLSCQSVLAGVEDVAMGPLTSTHPTDNRSRMAVMSLCQGPFMCLLAKIPRRLVNNIAPSPRWALHSAAVDVFGVGDVCMTAQLALCA